MDIEHIQSVTDEDDADGVLEKWGPEIDRMGNLVLLERSINRRIKNHTADKPEAYKDSTFVSVRELSGQVGAWSPEQAVARRKADTELLRKFLLS